MMKQVMKALENARANLDQAIAGLEKIPEIDAETVGYTAHKLKNYLAVVGAASELLEVYLAGHPDEQVQIWIEGMQHAVQLMKHDVGRLMFSANGTAPKFKLEKVDMALLAFRGCNFYRHKAAWKKIQVNSELQPDCCFAWTDRVAVAVILDNLLSNALKFSENGRQIWVTVRTEQAHVICTVRDEGPGLSVEDQARLFQMGVRLSNSPTGGEPTLGYGLVIAKDLVEKLGGSIWCESHPGSGATFHVRLPAFRKNL
jgi:two-component system, sensor histidine kinase and response regulator